MSHNKSSRSRHALDKNVFIPCCLIHLLHRLVPTKYEHIQEGVTSSVLQVLPQPIKLHCKVKRINSPKQKGGGGIYLPMQDFVL